MLVEMGNSACKTTDHDEPVVTYFRVPDERGVDDEHGRAAYNPAYPDDPRSKFDDAKSLAQEVMRQVFRGAASGVTHLPEQTAVFEVVAAWQAESNGDPDWVWSDNEDFAVLLSEVFGCPVGRPDDVEDRYHTHPGLPPGVHPVVGEDVPTEAEVVEETTETTLAPSESAPPLVAEEAPANE